MDFKKSFDHGREGARSELKSLHEERKKFDEKYEIERNIIQKMLIELRDGLPKDELEKNGLSVDHFNWRQLVIWIPGKTATTIASVDYDENTNQFLFSNHTSNFEVKWPVPPYRKNLPLLAQYIGLSVEWHLQDEVDKEAYAQYLKDGRKFRDPHTTPDY